MEMMKGNSRLWGFSFAGLKNGDFIKGTQGTELQFNGMEINISNFNNNSEA